MSFWEEFNHENVMFCLENCVHLTTFEKFLPYNAVCVCICTCVCIREKKRGRSKREGEGESVY